MIRNTAKAIRPARTIVVSCLRRQQCACASAAAGPSRMHAERESQARDRFAESFENESSFREVSAYGRSHWKLDSFSVYLRTDSSVLIIFSSITSFTVHAVPHVEHCLLTIFWRRRQLRRRLTLR